jgi:hypothetical protein
VSAQRTDGEMRSERERLLDPVDRISEILFGLIMAVTIVGSLSIASAGAGEVRTVLLAALGCNVAWGLVDAVMYIVRTATERSRLRVLGGRVRAADAARGGQLIASDLPEHLAPLVGPEEIEAMRVRLVSRAHDHSALLRPRHFAEAAAVFAVVVLATFPVVLPFIFVDDVATGMRYSQAITVVMLFIAGIAFGRHAGRPHPLRTGAFMAVFGVVLIAAVKALGG